MSEPEVVKPNQIHFGIDDIREKNALNTLVHFLKTIEIILHSQVKTRYLYKIIQKMKTKLF